MPFNPSTSGSSGVGGYPVVLNSVANGQTLVFNATTETWNNGTGGVSPSNPNTWTALQTFGNNISIGGITFAISSPVSGQVIGYNGTNWVNITPASGGVTSVSNSDGTLTISPTSGAVVASLNTAHANTWTALQTFSSGITVSAGTITFDTVPQASQGGYSENTGYGTGALNSNSGNNANSAFGYQALYSTVSAYNNSAFGYVSLYNNTTGSYNSAFGAFTLYGNRSGSSNSAFGYYALDSNTTGSSNSAFGYWALANDTTGSYNSAFGYYALGNYNNTTSTSGYMLGLGFQAGVNYTGSETNNIVIGYNEGVAGESYMLRIGNPDAGVTGLGQIAFSMMNLSGLGLAPIYGAGLLVSIGTTATTIASYTPTSSTGQFFVVKWVLSAAAAATPTLTLTFTDPKAGAQTVTLFNSAMTADTVAQDTYVLVATSATAITVSATSTAASDIFGSATISEEQ